jgi:hypothetical protein
MKLLRHVTEAEVIAEFLKNEFYQEEFHHDREQFEQLVWELTSRMKRPIHCAGRFYSVAGDICGESCLATPRGGKCKSSPKTWSGFGYFPGRSGAR